MRTSLPPRALGRLRRYAALASVVAAATVLASMPAANGGTDARPPTQRARRVAIVSRPPSTSHATVVTTAHPSTPRPPTRRPTAVVAPAVAPPAEATVTIARVGISQAVFLGGQATIDRWVVAHYSDPRWSPPTGPGAPGTYWLAAHATNFGGPFQFLRNVVVGDRIDIQVTNGSHFVYRVTSTELTEPEVEPSTVYGNDPDARLILLQTCEGHNARLLVHGILVPSG